MKNKFKIAVFYLLVFLSSLLVQATFWVPDNFGEVSVAQIIFHLKAPLEGANTSFFESFMVNCVLVSLIVAFVLTFFVFKKRDL